MGGGESSSSTWGKPTKGFKTCNDCFKREKCIDPKRTICWMKKASKKISGHLNDLEQHLPRACWVYHSCP